MVNSTVTSALRQGDLAALLAEGLAIAIENVAAAVTRLFVVLAVVTAPFAVSLAVAMVMVVMRQSLGGGRRGADYCQRQCAQEHPTIAGPTHPTSSPALLVEPRDVPTPEYRLQHAIVPGRNAHGSGG
jgi:hypothetical protein